MLATAELDPLVREVFATHLTRPGFEQFGQSLSDFIVDVSVGVTRLRTALAFH